MRALLLAGLLTFATSAADAAPAVIGYLPSIRGIDATLGATDLEPYTQVTLAFVNPDASGRFVNGANMACMTDRMLTPVPVATVRHAVDTLHGKGKRAVASLAGALLPVCTGSWTSLTSPARRTATVAALVALTDQAGLDGLDVDIEGDLLARLVTNGSYTPFVKALSTALHARHKTLSGTTASYVGGMIPLAAIPAFDQIEVMTYDDAVPGQEEAPMATYKSALYLWLGRGVARDKLILGVPFYGDGYGTYQPFYSYRDLVTQFGPQSGDVIGQMCATCNYVTFNGPATLRAKAALTAAKAGGVLVWEISQDTPDAALITAVGDGLKMPPGPSNAAPVTATPAGKPLNIPDVRSWTIDATAASYGLVNDPAMPNGNALEITVPKPTENDWDIDVTQPITGAIHAGDRIHFAVWARLKAADTETQLDIPATLQLADAPYTEFLNGNLTVTTQWQLLQISGVAPRDYAPGKASAALSVGNAAKVIDLGPAIITDDGK